MQYSYEYEYTLRILRPPSGGKYSTVAIGDLLWGDPRAYGERIVPYALVLILHIFRYLCSDEDETRKAVLG